MTPAETTRLCDELDAHLEECWLQISIAPKELFAVTNAARREAKLREFVESLLEQAETYWLHESEAKGEMRELGIPNDADAPVQVTMGQLRAALKDAGQ